MFQIVFCQKKLASVVALDARGKQKSHSEEIIRNIFCLFFILQLFLAAFFWFFFTSLFYTCCICAIVLLNKIDKKMFQKSFFIEVSFSVKIIGFEDLESRDNGGHVLLLCFWSTNMTCEKQRSNFMEEKTPYVLFFR